MYFSIVSITTRQMINKEIDVLYIKYWQMNFIIIIEMISLNTQWKHIFSQVQKYNISKADNYALVHKTSGYQFKRNYKQSLC